MSLFSKNGFVLSGMMWLALLPFCLFYTIALSVDSLYGGQVFKIAGKFYACIWIYYTAAFWFLACNAGEGFLSGFCEKYPFVSRMAMSVGWIVNLLLGFWIVEELAALAALLLHWLGLSFLTEYFESAAGGLKSFVVGNADEAEGERLAERARMVLLLGMTFVSLAVFFVRQKICRKQGGERA